MTSPATARRVRRGAYLLPSLFTMGNILLGFWAVVSGFRGEFYEAAWMIILAGILDGLDGRIARLTGTESEFGKEFDSLADVLTFGAAPAYVAYLWGLTEFGRIGWLIPLFYLLCTSVRLARFNVQSRVVDNKSFVGLPSPAGAGSIACLLFLDHQLEGMEGIRQLSSGIMAAALITAGLLMVTTFRYPSLKRIDFRRRWSYRAGVLLAGVLLLLVFRPVLFFQFGAAFYILAGPITWLTSRRRNDSTEATTAKP